MNKKIVAILLGLIFLSTLQTSFAITGSGYSIECDGDDKVFVNPEGQIIRRFHCRHGCSNGACNDAQSSSYSSGDSTYGQTYSGSCGVTYEWRCRDSKTREKVDTRCNNVLRTEKCTGNTVCKSGQCVAERKRIDYDLFCKPGQPNKLFIENKYSDGTTEIKEFKTCHYSMQCYKGNCVSKSRIAQLEQHPDYKLECRGDWIVKTQRGCGNIIEYVKWCPNGCINGVCRKEAEFKPTPTPAPNYKWKCSGGDSIKFNPATGYIAISHSCEYGCNWWTGKCNPKPASSSSTSCNTTYCKVSYRKETTRYWYGSNPYNSENNNYNNTYNTAENPYNSTYSFNENNSNSSTVTSGYASIYGRKPSNQCTYNSDCGVGYRCVHYSSGNRCVANSTQNTYKKYRRV